VSIFAAHVARWAIMRTTRSGRRANVGIVLGRLSYFGVILLGALVAVTIVAPSMTPARLVSLLGLGGVAIGFAFKDIFQNMLAGVLLLWREPFRIGDEITSVTFTGKVEAIETRATLVKTYDGKRIIIPNSQIYTEAVSVISAYDMLRSEYDIGIGYGDDISKAKDILHDILDHDEEILREPGPDLLVWELAGSTVNVRARWWTKLDRTSVVRVRGRVLEQVCRRFPDAGIDLPYPTQVMLFHDQTEETDGDRSRQRAGWPAGETPPAPARISAALRGTDTARVDRPSVGRGPRPA
jgi:small-conductance mechanosensitive channel